jgi:hypothetical protein
MKLLVFISLPHLGQDNGSTAQTFLMHSRHLGDNFKLSAGGAALQENIIAVSYFFVSNSYTHT